MMMPSGTLADNNYAARTGCGGKGAYNVEITYDITAEDYIAFNLNYMRTNPVSKRGILKARIQGVVLILAGGGVCGYLYGAYTPFLIAVFVLAAALFAVFIPRTITKKVTENVRKTLKQSGSIACGRKTMTLEDGRFRLRGEGEDSLYHYAKVQKIVEDTAHYYIYVGAMEALIVPFSAFADAMVRKVFFEDLRTRVQAAGGAV